MEKQIKQLIEMIRSYNRHVDLTLVKKAYTVAKAAHLDQYRKSGEEYIFHPLGVARILAEMGLDVTSIAAALLHDVVEDTETTLDEIAETFGSEVAELIDGLTKLGKIDFVSREEEQAENLRKMLISMAKDIRVILIKIADRLDNMRTIEHLSEEKQRQKAKETLDIYAPLAHRLGIFKAKWELEDLSFRVLEPKKYAQIAKTVAETRKQREAYLEEATSQLSIELKKMKIKHEIIGRVKHYYSIDQKMLRRGKDFNEIYDLSGLRVLVNSVKDCYGTLGVAHSIWKPIPGKFKDYIAMPKFNMYRSLHTVVIGPNGKPLELQIRTYEMHKTADYGIAAHWRYKEGGKMDKFEERLSWLRQMLEWESETKDPTDFLETLKTDLFESEVFVFTPKGKVISLPMGSTPLDFAYTIHTDVGHRCIGAKVGGKIVPLSYELRSGDIVEILTSKSSNPSRDWLKVVKTSRARTKIRQWFSKENREGMEHAGKDALAKELRKKGLSLASVPAESLLSAAKSLNVSDLETLYVNIGSGNVSPRQFVTKLLNVMNITEPEEEAALEIKPPSASKKPEGRGKGVRVAGSEGMLTRLARCCDPVPNDEIVGFITVGRGVTIHRKDCSNMKSIMAKHPARLIDVRWDVSGSDLFQAEIQVEAIDRTKLLRDISSAISEMGVNIRSASLLTDKNNVAIFKFVFDISSLAHLDHILANVKRIDSVFDAYRVSA